MIEIAVVKRRALYKDEIGLFAVDQIADEEIKRLPNDEAPLWAEITTPASLKLLRLLWAIATKLAQGGLYPDKDVAMEDLKIRARHARFAVEKDRVVIVPRTLSRLSRDKLSRLADRMIFVVCDQLLPGMDESEFRAELEKMLT
jgi:hypothetical protein